MATTTEVPPMYPQCLVIRTIADTRAAYILSYHVNNTIKFYSFQIKISKPYIFSPTYNNYTPLK